MSGIFDDLSNSWISKVGICFNDMSLIKVKKQEQNYHEMLHDHLSIQYIAVMDSIYFPPILNFSITLRTILLNIEVN